MFSCRDMQRAANGDVVGTIQATGNVEWLKSCALKGTITKKIKEAMTKSFAEMITEADAFFQQDLPAMIKQ
eukprot:m.331305 g.331305  ORF g.331305 m.331305 type:complete len:71 (-) comp20473_c0_seq2:383-595(-)